MVAHKLITMTITYFSSATENTHKFVQKLGLPNTRIPLKGPALTIDEPYILITPTYGGGATLHGEKAPHIPKQVATFLNHKNNAHYLKAIIASGNTNFGIDYAAIGPIIANKYNIPLLYTFELMGTEEDVSNVRHIITEKIPELHLKPLTQQELDTLEKATSVPPENQTRLEALRKKYGH